MPEPANLLTAFLQRNQLSADYLAQAAQWFDPLLARISQRVTTQRPLLVGISGCQGSGKSTLAEYLCAALTQQYNLATVYCSLDDFYLPRVERQQLAQSVHPLLATRGVPGTHDVALACEKLGQLRAASGEVELPLFAKQDDDRAKETNHIALPVDIIVFEGWCLGATHQNEASLASPVNSLEREHDQQGVWRRYVNDQLATSYRELFAQIDYWVMLQAPGFACVKQWRMEQEAKLASRLGNGKHQHLMSEQELEHFIQHYQRITEYLLQSLPARVDDLYTLDSQRRIVGHHMPRLPRE